MIVRLHVKMIVILLAVQGVTKAAKAVVLKVAMKVRNRQDVLIVAPLAVLPVLAVQLRVLALDVRAHALVVVAQGVQVLALAVVV